MPPTTLTAPVRGCIASAAIITIHFAKVKTKMKGAQQKAKPPRLVLKTKGGNRAQGARILLSAGQRAGTCQGAPSPTPGTGGRPSLSPQTRRAVLRSRSTVSPFRQAGTPLPRPTVTEGTSAAACPSALWGSPRLFCWWRRTHDDGDSPAHGDGRVGGARLRWVLLHNPTRGEEDAETATNGHFLLENLPAFVYN